MKNSIIFCAFLAFAFLAFASSTALPCPTSCTTCSSSTACTACAAHYYASVSAGSLTCLPCSQFCQSCSSPTACSRCMDPYVLNSTDNQCYECEIAYATVCSSVVAATGCETGRYASDNYCYSCLLNCASCSSNSDCQSCQSGYFLNSSVLTCNLCPSNCLTCDQYNSSRCLSCSSGYSLNATYNCQAVSCSVANCQYCSSTNVCGMCSPWYYWDSSTQKCEVGASIVCSNGAEGPFPNECNNKCTSYSYEVKEDYSSSKIWCIPYRNVRISSSGVSSIYAQTYFYLYNQLSEFKTYLTASASNSLSLEATGEYSLQIDCTGEAYISLTLPSYYQLTAYLKYRTAASSLKLVMQATTETDVQEQTASLDGAQSVAAVRKFSSVYLHSNNLKMSLSASSPVWLVELLVRVKKCPDGCFRCLNTELCEMCEEPQYVSGYKCVDNCTIYYHMVSNRSCLTSCPDAYYSSIISATSKFCEPCVAPCLHCIDALKCLTCTEGFYFYQYQCLASCPNGYFKSSTRECEPCISPCKLCLNQTACLSCDEGFWTGTRCTNKCPNGTYGNTTLKQCVSCQSPCASCQSTATKCSTCITAYYFHESKCLESCPERYYPITSPILTCSQCIPPCFSCSSASVCLTCSYNYLSQGQCLVDCPERGFYENLASRVCSSCNQSCLTCEMAGLCTSCKGGCFLEGACVTECAYGLYYPVTLPHASLGDSICECLECSYPCLQCLSATKCLSCLEGYYYETNNSCLSQCPVGYFPNDTSFTCDKCNSSFGSSCLECNKTGCTRCSSPAILHNLVCLSECPEYHYSSSEKCHKCVAPCLGCLSFTECLSCIDPYILQGDSCLIQCPFGQISVLVDGSYLCRPCSTPCLSCSVTQTNCTMCVYGYFLFENHCYLNCSSQISPANTYYNEMVTSSCMNCLFPCKTCRSQSACLTCAVGYLTSESKCEACPYGTFANDSSNSCDTCPPECSICFSYDYCTACHAGYYLYGHQCVSDPAICIDNGYYAIGRKCELCSVPCSKCNITATNCLTCLTGYIFYAPNKCITDCPKGTFRQSTSLSSATTCEPCDIACKSCATFSTYCFSCQSGFLHVAATMSCVSTCPAQTYQQGTTNCLPCRYPCFDCSSESSCKSCLTGTLISNQCLTSCPDGEFSNSSNVCEQCTSPCKECEASATECTQCQSGFYLHEAQCLSVCPPLYFAEVEARQCLACLGLCEECSSHINCTTCASPLIYYYNQGKDYGQCVSECPVKFYSSMEPFGSTERLVCSPCRSDCLTCLDDSSCLLCLNNKPQHLGECLDECPAQMYVASGICKDCSNPCFNCSDTFTCTSCMDDSFLLVGSAQCIVGDTCPLGFYLIPGTRLCNGKCPEGFYHRNDRTCNSDGCDTDEYKGADMFCYSQCPSGYISNANYECVSCSDNCDDGLFFSITSQIKRQQLFLYLQFTETPYYAPGVVAPSLELYPPFNHVVNLYTSRLLVPYIISDSFSRLLATSSPQNITIELLPQKSFGMQSMKLSFTNALETYTNPLQRPYGTFFLEGYDLYPNLPSFSIGMLALLCGLVGLVKYPFMVDFSQLIFLLGLLNLHYPQHLASTLESSSLAHFNSIIPVDQGIKSLGVGKFSYVTNMGLLSNCAFNLILIAAGLFLIGVVLIVYHILAKSSHYNRVDQDPYAVNDPEGVASMEKKQQKSTKRSVFECLRDNFVSRLIPAYINRLAYFNYLPITLFSFCQISIGAAEGTTGMIALALAIISLLGLTLAFPIIMFKSEKPKYSFLMVRKIVLALALVLSVENPTYMIGVTAVISLTTALLVNAYSLEKWAPETKFIVSLELLQFLAIVMLAIFAMVGEGNHTSVRVKIGWGIIFLLALILILYFAFAIFQLVLLILKKCCSLDFREKWAQQQNTNNSEEKDSEANSNPDTKDKESGKEQSSKSIKIEKMLNNLGHRDSGKADVVINNNQLFWTYNEDEDNQDEKSEQRAPEMLVRCINEFSDFDPSEKRPDST